MTSFQQTRAPNMTVDPRVKPVAAIQTAPLFDIVVDLNPKLNIGDVPLGRRILFGAAGGTFEGPKLRGEVVAGGGDWALFRADGAMSLDVRLTLRTHDDALLQMTYGGRWITPADLRVEMADPTKRYQVDPSRYYFRTNPLFETGAAQYAWMNDIVCIGSGYLVEGGIAYNVCQII
jgi:hypothetical protein